MPRKGVQRAGLSAYRARPLIAYMRPLPVLIAIAAAAVFVFVVEWTLRVFHGPPVVAVVDRATAAPRAAAAPPSAPADAPPAPQQLPQPEEHAAPLEEFESILMAAIDAYHRRDYEAFSALFAANAQPPMTRENFERLFVRAYHEELGTLQSKQFEMNSSSLDRDLGSLVYTCTFEKHFGWVSMRASFRRENGVLKLAQIFLAW